MNLRTVYISFVTAGALVASWAFAERQLDLYVDIPVQSTIAQTQLAIDNLVANASAGGVRRLIPSLTRADGSVMWVTPLEQYDNLRTSHLAGGFDALQYTIGKAHSAGIEVYPSVITAMGGRIVTDNPQWKALNAAGQPGGDPQFTTHSLSFAHAGARQAKVNQFLDLVNNYDVDGVFLDYARYFGGFGYDQPTLDAVQTKYGFDARTAALPPGPWPEHAYAGGGNTYSQWRLFAAERAATVKQFVEEFGDAIDSSDRPQTRLGTFADHRKKLYLDSAHLGRNFADWAQSGLVDDVFLGNYDEPIIGVPGNLDQIGIRQSVNWTRNGVPPVSGVPYQPGVGSSVVLASSLTRSLGVSLSTEAQYFQAAAESLIGGADRLFVYQGAGLTQAEWTILRRTSEKVEKLTAFQTVSTKVREYDAAIETAPPSSASGWSHGGAEMVHVAGPVGALRQSASDATAWYQSPAYAGLMTGNGSEYAIEFRVRPLSDVANTNANLRNLHVMWADGADAFSLQIDQDTNGGASGTAGSINYGWSSPLLPAIGGINWSEPHTIQVQYHADNATFYFFIDGRFVSYLDESAVRIGNFDGFPELPDLRDRLLFGDSTAGGTSASADWHFVRAHSLITGTKWNSNADGSWHTLGNWIGAIPNAPGAVANFTDAINAARTITIAQPTTVGRMTFDNVNRYTVAGTAMLTLLGAADAGGNASIDVFAGGHTISAPLHLAGNTSFNTIASGSSLTVSTSITGGAPVTLGKTGPGTLEVRQMNVGRVEQHAGTIKLTPDGTAAGRSVIGDIEITGGRFDITNNALVVDYAGASPSADIAQLIRDGYNGGAWTGTGIVSSLANIARAVGFAEASSLTSIPALFGDVDADAILIRFTRYGDADLDGIVGLDDFNRLASSFGQANKLWSDGDFTYDGTVNLDDFNRLASNFGLSVGPDGPSPEDWAALAAAVPEPGVGWLFASVAWLTYRRRR